MSIDTSQICWSISFNIDGVHVTLILDEYSYVCKPLLACNTCDGDAFTNVPVHTCSALLKESPCCFMIAIVIKAEAGFPQKEQVLLLQDQPTESQPQQHRTLLSSLNPFSSPSPFPLFAQDL